MRRNVQVTRNKTKDFFLVFSLSQNCSHVYKALKAKQQILLNSVGCKNVSNDNV